MSEAAGPAQVRRVSADASAGQVVQAAVARSVGQLLHHEPGVRAGDPESVHQARVATRRLRSDLRTFAPLLNRRSADTIRAELGLVGGALGLVRDADVLSLRLAAHGAELPPPMQPAVRRLLAGLTAQAERERGNLLAVLDSPRYAALVELLVHTAASPPLTAAAGEAGAPATAAAVRKPWTKLVKAVAALGKAPPDSRLHAVRIRAKGVRYAAEAASDVWGKPAARLAKQVAGVQTVLGRLQDAAVAEEWLTGAAYDGSTGVAAGALISIQWRDAAEARAAFPKAWAAVGRGGTTAWLDVE